MRGTRRSITMISFNSLQTGRTFRTSDRSHNAQVIQCFNSLQTGRTFRTTKTAQLSKTAAHTVSIPFKREGLSELYRMLLKYYSRLCFNSLQTGRTFRTLMETTDGITQPSLVSIPFKREGLSEQTARNRIQHRPRVSIPFKREGLSERLLILQQDNLHVFQFPSNGKDFPNCV